MATFNACSDEELAKAVTEHEVMVKFHNDVRDVAIRMCKEMGLDPYIIIRVDPFDARRRTPYEMAQQPGDFNENFKAANSIAIAQWEFYRRDAAIALAGWRAVHQNALMS